MMMNWIDVGDRLPKISDDNKHDKKHVIIVVNEGNDRYVTEGWYGWQQELECDIYCQETWVWHKVFSDGGKNMIFVGSRTPEALALAHHYAELHNLEVLGWTTYEDKDYIDGRHCF